jgi:hypothetical protein
MPHKSKQSGFLCLFSLIYFSLISSPSGRADIGLDASWAEALALSIDNGKVFGRDFIFNYGPLGYFNTGILPTNTSVFVLIVLQISILLNYLFIIWFGFQKAGDKWGSVAIAALCILLPWGFISDISFTYFYFFLFWLLHAQQTQRQIGLFCALLCAVLLFYVKVNLSLIVYTLFTLSLIWFWFCRVFTFKIIATALSILFIATYLLSLVLNVDIVAYLSASIKIIDAYQDAMAVVIATKRELVFFVSITALILLSVLVVVWLNFKTIWQDKKLILLFAFVAIAWFLDFKQAHTAISFPNLLGYYIFMPPLVVLLYLFVPKSMSQSVSRLFVVVFCLQLVAIQVIRYRLTGANTKGYALSFVSDDIEKKLQKGLTGSDILEIIVNKTPYNYIKNAVSYHHEDYFQTNLRPLPKAFLEKYGKTTIDIVPTDIDYVYFNGLNYNPRPVIQSYQANSDWLMAKNGEKYLSETAPQTVLYRVESFRDQNPFWVETDLTKALLRRYQLTDSVATKFHNFLIFTKNNKIKYLNYRLLQQKQFTINQEITITESDKPILFTANIEYSFWGKISRLLFQPPYLYCTLSYDNGSQETYRVIDKILKGGIIVNRKVSNQGEATSFFSNQNHKNLRVAKIRFWAKYQWGFKSDFEGKTEEISIE